MRKSRTGRAKRAEGRGKRIEESREVLRFGPEGLGYTWKASVRFNSLHFKKVW